ncbi:MAG: ATP-binding cassette domain-containing protein, partial [Elusimicrobia bacterium]|nr:ATP-binding cassette domain-containing protein [Elusimicrobiota bacterium]
MTKRKGEVKIQIKNLNLYYSSFHALKNINMDIRANRITALIGPSGCGKSTLLRTLNRINDTIDGVKITGEILINGKNIYGEDMQ